MKWLTQLKTPRGLLTLGIIVVGSALVAIWLARVPWSSVGKKVPDPTEDMVFIETDDGGFYIDPFEFPNKETAKPATLSTIQEAREACAEVGKRLCTDAEWRRACLGPGGKNTYGYGSDLDRTRCNSEKMLPSGHSGIVNPEAYREGVTASGTLRECRSEEGIYDMPGNMEEWVLSSWQGLGANLEGGAWFTVAEYASCTGAYSRQPHYIIELKRPLNSAGTRCCWSEEAPTEADLSEAALAEDTTHRLRVANERESKKPYDPKNEVQVSPGLWIDRYEYPNRAGESPQVGVSWKEAQESCRAGGKRLCTVTEWETACRDQPESDIPEGERHRSDTCALLLDEAPKAGEYDRCRSTSGAMDMIGSVWEWTVDKMEKPQNVYQETIILREVRGGSWLTVHGDGACRPIYGFPAASQDAMFPDVGFRCCRGDAGEASVTTSPTEAPAITERIPCPTSMVAVGDFCIDQYEYPARAGEMPWGNQSYEEAVGICKARGIHLCSTDEWMLACAGREQRRWPYGDKADPKACNHGQGKEVGPNPLSAAGSMSGCRTPEGVYDLSGNMWEWTTTPSGGVLRGGGPSFNALFGQCTATATPKPGYRAFDSGVRCCGSLEEIESILGKLKDGSDR